VCMCSVVCVCECVCVNVCVCVVCVWCVCVCVCSGTAVDFVVSLWRLSVQLCHSSCFKFLVSIFGISFVNQPTKQTNKYPSFKWTVNKPLRFVLNNIQFNSIQFNSIQFSGRSNRFLSSENIEPGSGALPALCLRGARRLWAWSWPLTAL